jgi:hypothetical protein
VGPPTGLFDVGGQRLVTPPIRGRADELKVIGALVTAVAQGRGGVLVIEGPPGIGKSRLLTEVLALADKFAVRTLFGEAFEYQQAVPFFSLFMATLRADPPVGDVEALRRLGGSADLRYWVETCCSRRSMTRATPTPPAHIMCVGQRRMCWRWRRGSAAMSTTQCAGWAATSPYSEHHSRLRS